MPKILNKITLPKYPSAPGSATAGDTYYDTSLNKPFTYNGSAWVDLTLTGSGAIYYHDEDPTLTIANGGLEVTASDGDIWIDSDETTIDVPSAGTIQNINAISPIWTTGGTSPEIYIYDADIGVKGAVSLSDTINPASNTEAATTQLVKDVYDYAATKINTVYTSAPLIATGNKDVTISINSATLTDSGIVQLEESVTSTSSTTAATPSSVRLAYNKAEEKISSITGTAPIVVAGTSTEKSIGIASATLFASGVVVLENSTSSTSVTKAAVPASVKAAYDLAYGKADPGQEFYIGTTPTQINRGIGAQNLAGILSIQMPGSTSGNSTIIPSAVAGTTTFVLPGSSGTISTDTSLAAGFSAGTINTLRVTGLSAPTVNTDAVNKEYADSIAAGINTHGSAIAATTTNLSATYANGTLDASGGLGIGASLTSNANAALVIDDITIAVNDRVLIKDQSNAAHNGIYKMTVLGTVSVPWVLVRAEDSRNDFAGEVNSGDYVYILSGTANGSQGWVMTSIGTSTTPSGAIKIGTDAISWTQFTGISDLTAGAGLVRDGNKINIATASTARVVVNSNNIDLATVTASNTTSTTPTSALTGITVDSYGRVSGYQTTDVTYSSVAGTIVYRDPSNIVYLSDLRLTVAATSDLAFRVQLSGDTNARIRIRPDGIGFGNGSSAIDAIVSRNSAGVLDSNAKVRVTTASSASDQLQITDTTAGAGITIGADTNLYRSAANTLKTDDSFFAAAIESAGVITSNSSGAAGSSSIRAKLSADTAYRIAITNDAVINFGDGTNLVDTNLYRSAANTLKTDDAFVVAVSVTTPSLITTGATSGTITLTPTAIAGSNTLTLPAATDTLIGKATTDTLTNKSLSDSTVWLVDATDNTKRLNIDVAGTTGITGTLQSAFTTAKTLIFPDASDTLVGKATSDVLTNKSLSDSTTWIVDATDNTKRMTFDIAGTTALTSTISWAPTAARTLTLPDATSTVSVLGIAQTFTAAQTFRAASSVRAEAAATQDAVVLAGRAGGTTSLAATITPTTLTASRTLTIPDNSGTFALAADTYFIGTTSVALNRASANLALAGITSVAMPGATSGTLTVQPAATAGTSTLTLPGVTDTVAVVGTAQTFTAAQTFRAANAIRSEAASTQDAVVVAGRAGGTGSFAVTLIPTTLTASRTLTLPDLAGTIATNVTTTIGDVIYASATGTPGTLARLAGNTATQPAFLTSTGSGTANLTTTFTSSTGSGNVVLASNPSLTTPAIGAATGTSLSATGSITSSGTAGVGYATGAGGTIAQGTSKATGVTLSKTVGQITTNSASLAAATVVSFVVTNTTVAATDIIILNHVSTGTFGAYTLNARAAAGSFTIDIRNNTAGPLSEAIVIGFAVIKGVTA